MVRRSHQAIVALENEARGNVHDFSLVAPDCDLGLSLLNQLVSFVFWPKGTELFG